MTRTEDDLRAAYHALGRQAPEPWAILRAIYEPPRRRARPQQRLRFGLAAAAATAAVAAAVAVTLASSPSAAPRQAGGPGAGTPLRARLLAAIDGARADILFAHGTSPGQGTWAAPWYPRSGQQVRLHLLGRNAQGTPAKDTEFVFRMPAAGAASNPANPIDWGALHVTGTALTVDHVRHTWSKWHHQNITTGLPLDATAIRREITSGRLHVITRTRLGGKPAIELGMTLPGRTTGPLRVTIAHLWVNADTYLPMRQLLQFSDGTQDLSNYTFLQPTATNLAKLKPVIPAGYHRTYQRPDASKGQK
jgi:hypothetical protein